MVLVSPTPYSSIKSFVKYIPQKEERFSSNFSGTDLPPGNSVIDINYADDIVLFDEYINTEPHGHIE